MPDFTANITLQINVFSCDTEQEALDRLFRFVSMLSNISDETQTVSPFLSWNLCEYELLDQDRNQLPKQEG